MPTLSMEDMLRYEMDDYAIVENTFGNLHFQKVDHEGIKSEIYMPEGGLFSEPEHFSNAFAAMKRAREQPEIYQKASNDTLEC